MLQSFSRVNVKRVHVLLDKVVYTVEGRQATIAPMWSQSPCQDLDDAAVQ